MRAAARPARASRRRTRTPAISTTVAMAKWMRMLRWRSQDPDHALEGVVEALDQGRRARRAARPSGGGGWRRRNGDARRGCGFVVLIRAGTPPRRIHLVAVVVAEQVQQPVHRAGVRQASPTTCGQRTTSPSWRGTPARQLVAAVDREREHVRWLRRCRGARASARASRRVRRAPLRARRLRSPRAASTRRHERPRAHRSSSGDAAAVVDARISITVRHACESVRIAVGQRRCVPVSSAWRLYASTMRWTSLCRTTSWLPNSMNAMPSISPRISRTWMRPERLVARQVDLRHVAGHDDLRAEAEPRQEHLHLLGVVFWASSRMMNESLSVRPRMNASGATSIMPFSMYAASRSESSMS